jgi:hypothetical protein
MIKPLIDEADDALSKNEGSESLANILERIKEIKDGLTDEDETYEEF